MMADRKRYCLLAIFLLLMLTSCSSREDISETGTPETEELMIPSDEPKPDYLEPPDLLVMIDGERLQPARGTYSWSADMGNGMMEAIEAESSAPPELVESHTPREVTKDSEIELNFETPPVSYEIRIWNEDGTTKNTAEQFRLADQQGKVIYEVVAKWEEGEVHYAFTVDVNQQ